VREALSRADAFCGRGFSPDSFCGRGFSPDSFCGRPWAIAETESSQQWVKKEELLGAAATFVW